MTDAAASRRFTLFSRHDCALCEEMQMQFQSMPEAVNWQLEVLDVDADVAARGRYGHKVPVLLLDGELVCHGRLDREELLKAVSLRG